MKILIKGAGDLATGVAYELFARGHQIIMTEIEEPLTVRRQVAFSRAVYRGSTVVEGVVAERADVFATDVGKQSPDSVTLLQSIDTRQDINKKKNTNTVQNVNIKYSNQAQTVKAAQDILAQGKIAVMVDPEAVVVDAYHPDVIIDAIMAKKNTGTKMTDAPFVISLGPGFTAGKDCHAVIETKRGDSLGQPIYEGQAIPNTGVPGVIGGYAIERLIRASADGTMEPVKHIGDEVRKGEILARTGNEPVYAQIDGIIRGMLQPGVKVKKGLKIGDVDPRKNPALVYKISDKARKIGVGVCEAIAHLCRKDCGILLLAAGESRRYGGDKLLENIQGQPMYQYSLKHMEAFPECVRAVVTRFADIEAAAEAQGILAVQNDHPEEGISRSLRLGLQKLMEINPDMRGVLCMVCDQPYVKTDTIERMFVYASGVSSRIVCAGTRERQGNPVWFGRDYFDELMALKGDVGGKQVVRRYPEHVVVCPASVRELMDIDYRFEGEKHA